MGDQDVKSTQTLSGDEVCTQTFPKDECLVCHNALVLPYTSPCGHVFCYLCLKSKCEYNSVCPVCHYLISFDICENVENPAGSIYLESTKPTWLYQGRNDGWWRYDPVTDKILEEGYQNYLNEHDSSTIDVTILNRSYIIDFEHMTQAPRFFGQTRGIKRVDEDNDNIFIKGIAGLQNPKPTPTTTTFTPDRSKNFTI